MNFKQWENKVNELMIKHYGAGVDDIPDMPYYDWFTDDITPESAVALAITIVNENGF